jgi:hypothetical protein
MRKSLIIILLFVLACHSRDDENIALLDKTIEKCNSEIDSSCGTFYINAEKSFLENPSKTIVLKHIEEQIKIKSERIFLIIKQLEQEVLPQKSDYTQIPEYDKDRLFNSIKEYKQLIDSLFPNDSIISQSLKNEIDLNKSRAENFKIQDLNLLANHIQSTNYLALDYFNSKIVFPDYGENKLQVAVVPQSKYLYFNGIYKADIYLFPIDSDANFTVEIDKKILGSKKGMVEYMDSNTKHPGIVSKKGSIKVDYYGVTFYYPFAFNYKIVTK